MMIDDDDENWCSWAAPLLAGAKIKIKRRAIISSLRTEDFIYRHIAS
jgi:hypothetical protein